MCIKFQILTPRFREMPTLKCFANSVDMWSHSSVGMFIYYFLIGHKMVHFYQLILNIDDVCLKLYTPKCTLFAGSTVSIPRLRDTQESREPRHL